MPPKSSNKIEMVVEEEEVCRLQNSVSAVLTIKILTAILEYFQEIEAKIKSPACIRLVAIPRQGRDEHGLPLSGFISVRASTAYPKNTGTPPGKLNVGGVELDMPWASPPSPYEVKVTLLVDKNQIVVEKTEIVGDEGTTWSAECKEEGDEQPDDDYPEPLF